MVAFRDNQPKNGWEQVHLPQHLLLSAKRGSKKPTALAGQLTLAQKTGDLATNLSSDEQKKINNPRSNLPRKNSMG